MRKTVIALAVLSFAVASGFVIARPLLALDAEKYKNESGDIIQFNNLIVESASGAASGEIIASQYQWGTTKTTCARFANLEAEKGIRSICPLPPNTQGTPRYRIRVLEDASLSLRTRARGTLLDFGARDTINVFGFYNEDGSIRAVIMRNLTKPIPRNELQLENLEVVGIGSGEPKTLFVIQEADAACHRFDGSIKRKVICPIGFRAASESQVAQSTSIPEAVRARLDLVRKYEITLTPQTTIVDRNRKPMSANLIAAGDILHAYGSYAAPTAAQEITAEIVRNRSKPKGTQEATSFEGVITQINRADGSFVLRLRDGKLITVNNPISQTETFVTVKGTFDERSDTVTTLSQITVHEKTKLDAIPSIASVDPGSAPAGTWVTLVGSGFMAKNNSVFLGDSYLPNLASNGARLTFLVPSELKRKCHFASPPCLAPIVPLPPGIYPLSVENENGKSNQTSFQISLAPPFKIVTDILPQAIQNQRYSMSVEGQGGADSYLWTVSGTLPPGLAFTPPLCIAAPCRAPATIIGIPTTPGTYPLTITLKSGGETASREFSLVVVQAISTPY